MDKIFPLNTVKTTKEADESEEREQTWPEKFHINTKKRNYSQTSTRADSIQRDLSKKPSPTYSGCIREIIKFNQLSTQDVSASNEPSPRQLEGSYSQRSNKSENHR